ncbi:MAG: serine/threonine-protein kinase, partial [Myxococcaceae bacterium]
MHQRPTDEEDTITRSVGGPPGVGDTNAGKTQVAQAPMLDEEPRTEQVDASSLRVPKISLQPSVQAMKRIPGIPMESQPGVTPMSAHVAPRIAPSTPGAPSVRKTSSPSLPQLEPPTAGSSDPLIGQKVGDYVIQTQIGVGGMGMVYRGVQPLIGAPVAIKVLKPEAASDPQQVQRLLSEARVVNAIRHRGIVDIFNFARLPDGRHCVVMEYLHGKSLEDMLLKRGKLPLSEALPLFEEVLSALAAAHKAGVIHRDIKPSNIFVVEEHGKTYAKVLDFGIAKQSYAPDGLVAQTVLTRFMGTPGFVAPEQARAQPVGPLTDLYALGVVMFISMTGKPPFEANTPYELVKKHVELPVPSAARVEPTIPATLDRLIMSMMAKSADDRPQSAEIVREQLERIRLSIAGRTASGNTRRPDVP